MEHWTDKIKDKEVWTEEDWTIWFNGMIEEIEKLKEGVSELTDFMEDNKE